jgi:MFS family permease
MMDLAFEGKQAEQAKLALIVSSSLGGLAGGVLGGWIASQIGWRWAFLPSLLVFLFILGWGRFLPQNSPAYRTPIDWVGGLVSFLGFGLILLGLSLAGEFGWWEPKRIFSIAGIIIPPFAISIVPTLISAGVICLGFFVFWQRQQARKLGSSLLRIGLLRKPIFVVGMLTAMLHTLITTGVQFNLFQFLPVVLTLNPFQTAIAVLPYNLTMIIVIVVILKYLALDQQFPPKYIVYFGLVLLSVGIWSLYLAITPTMTSFTLIPALMVMGMGSGFFLSYVSALTYSVATRAEKPEGTGIYNPIQRLGNSLGRGILGTILVSFTSVQIVDRILQSLGQTLSPAQRQAAISSLERVIQTYSRTERREFFLANVPAAVRPELRDIVNDAALAGMKTTLLVALALSLICFFLAAVLPKSINRQSPIAPQATEPNAIEP